MPPACDRERAMQQADEMDDGEILHGAIDVSCVAFPQHGSEREQQGPMC